MKSCPVCHKDYDDDAKYCPVHGTELGHSVVPHDPLVGKKIRNRYKILSKLGSGAMGTVYLAEDENFGSKRALKILNSVTDDRFVRRFRTEARVAESLDHPNIVKVRDFDQDSDGRLFIAMEYIEGESLKDLIERGPLPIARTLELACQIAEGLGAAHRAGVTHRDVKPANIMVTAGDGRAKLVDFGLAQLRESDDTLATQPGAIMGTLAYMAPEQLDGNQPDNPVTPKSDLYAFGIVLYEMLSGSTPFKASRASEMLWKHQFEAPTRPSKLRADVPEFIERVVMQALEKDSNKRQRDMDEVVRGLQNVALKTANGTEPNVPAAIVSMPAGSAQKTENKKYYLWASLITLTVVALMATWFLKQSNDKVDQPTIVSLAILGKNQLMVGEKTVFKATGSYADGRAAEITRALSWQNNNNSVAALGQNGQLEALKEGLADITVGHEGLVSPPLRLIVTIPVGAKVQGLIKQAAPLSNQGDYDGALEKLAEALKLAPGDKAVQMEIQRTMNACVAEQRAKTTQSRCP